MSAMASAFSDQKYYINQLQNKFSNYQILNVTHGTPEEEIKRSFRFLSRKLHPDRNKLPEAVDAFEKVNKAYNSLLLKKEVFFDKDMIRQFVIHYGETEITKLGMY